MIRTLRVLPLRALTIVGRFLFATPMIVSGVLHFASSDDLVTDVPLPAPRVWVLATGAILVVAGAAVLLNRHLVLAGLVLAGLTFAIALFVHIPDVLAGDRDALPDMRSAVALSGSGLLLAALGRSRPVDPPRRAAATEA